MTITKYVDEFIDLVTITNSPPLDLTGGHLASHYGNWSQWVGHLMERHFLRIFMLSYRVA